MNHDKKHKKANNIKKPVLIKISNDEKIIKFITHELACLRASEENGSDRYEELTIAIDYLEKQGDIVKHYEDKLDKCACDNFNKGYKKALKKQGEHKETNLVEILKHYPRETELYSPLYGKLWLAKVDEKHEIIVCYKHRLDEGCTRAILEQEDTVSFYSNGTTGLPDFDVSKDCMLFLYDIEKQDRPMPAWTEEDERIYNKILDFFLGDYTTRCVTIDKQRSFGYWLKSLKDRALLQTTQDRKESDKVEPKFKVGDWITDGEYTWKIVEVKPLDYILQSQDDNIVDDTICYVDEHFHSFTVKDVKDGDVLCSGQIILLFEKWECNDWNFVIAYAGIDISGKLQVTNEHWLISNDAHPATKEQHDILLQKMREAGYEWDAENKELLKKIKQKSSWSEKDEKMFNSALWHVKNSCGKEGDVYNWLNSIKERIMS